MAIRNSTFSVYEQILFPGPSTGGTGRLWFDQLTQKFNISENGGPQQTLSGNLDSAYDSPSPGAGRFITVDAGAVQLTKSPVDATNAFEVIVTAGTGLAGLFTGASISCPGAGGSSERFGLGALAAGPSALAVGNNASASADSAVALGFSAVAAGIDAIAIGPSASTGIGTGSVVIGHSASTVGSNGVAIGPNSVVGTSGVALGFGATANNLDAIALGHNAVTGGIDAICIGRDTAATLEGIAIGHTSNAQTQAVVIGITAQAQIDGVAIGFGAMATGNNGVAIGSSATANTAGVALGEGATASSLSIALGAGSITTSSGQLVAGSTSGTISNVFFGSGASNAVPLAATIQGTGGLGAGVAGAELRIAGGVSGDNATAGGFVRLQTARAGSGTSLTDALVVDNVGNTTVSGTGNLITPGLALLVAAVQTVSFTATGADTLWPCDATAGVVTATLPLAASVPNGKIFRFKRVNSNANAVIIAASGGDTIDGAATQTLGSANASLDVQSDGVSKWYILSSASSAGPTWTKYTVGFAAFSTAALTNTLTLFSLPAGGMIHGVKIKHSTSFTGPGITSYVIAVGILSDTGKYSPAFDVQQGTGSTVFQVTSELGGEDQASPVNITITAVTTGANLNAATQGSVDVWVLTSVAA